MHDAHDLGPWLDVCLDETIRHLEGPTVWRAWAAFGDGEWDLLARLDREVIALRPSSAARQSIRAMGSRLLTAWAPLYPHERVDAMIDRARRGVIAPSLPVAFAAACASAGIDRYAALDGYAYTRLASTTSAAMRVMAIGQRDAHAYLARALDRVAPVAAAIAASDAPVEGFSPRMDVAAMSQQYLHSRLFRS